MFVSKYINVSPAAKVLNKKRMNVYKKKKRMKEMKEKEVIINMRRRNNNEIFYTLIQELLNNFFLVKKQMKNCENFYNTFFIDDEFSECIAGINFVPLYSMVLWSLSTKKFHINLYILIYSLTYSLTHSLTQFISRQQQTL